MRSIAQPMPLLHLNPSTGIEGKFSTAFNVALGMLKGWSEIPDYAAERMQEHAVRSLTRRVRHLDDPADGSVNFAGPLTYPADRDHCAQYVVALALIYGKLNASDFEDEFAADPRIDRLRAKMAAVEERSYTRERFDPEKRSNSNAIEVRCEDGSSPQKNRRN